MIRILIPYKTTVCYLENFYEPLHAWFYGSGVLRYLQFVKLCRCWYWLGFQMWCGWISILIHVVSGCSSHCRAIVLWKSALHEDTFQYLHPSKATAWTSLTHLAIHLSIGFRREKQIWGMSFTVTNKLVYYTVPHCFTIKFLWILLQELL